MSDVYSFSENRIESVLKLLENDTQAPRTGDGQDSDSNSAEFTILAECISLKVKNGKICINLPLGLGKECIDIPDWIPDGEAARACLSIKYKRVLGVKLPVGVKICVYVADTEVVCVDFSL